MYKAKIAVYSEIRIEHLTQSEHRVEFFNIINLAVRKEIVRLYRLSSSITFLSLFVLNRSKHRLWSNWNNTL